MLDLNKLLDMIKEMLSRISSKRLMAYAFFLLYISWLVYWLGKQTLAYDVLWLNVIVMVGAPFIALLVLVVSLSFRPGGDDLIQINNTVNNTTKA